MRVYDAARSSLPGARTAGDCAFAAAGFGEEAAARRPLCSPAILPRGAARESELRLGFLRRRRRRLSFVLSQCARRRTGDAARADPQGYALARPGAAARRLVEDPARRD